jgi:hypothetical protein
LSGGTTLARHHRPTQLSSTEQSGLANPLVLHPLFLDQLAAMSLSSTPTSSLSNDEPDTAAPVPARRTIALTVPTSLLVLPASAAIVGMIIGMSRGGSRARLRFLAENAHRPPTTVQGWVSDTLRGTLIVQLLISRYSRLVLLYQDEELSRFLRCGKNRREICPRAGRGNGSICPT